MPIDRRRDLRILAVIFADIVGSDDSADREALATALRFAADRVNELFGPALAEPFLCTTGDRIEGTLADPAQAPLCLSVMRETLAPRLLRAGVGIGSVDQIRDTSGTARDAFETARRALQLVAGDGGLTRYLGTGEAGDVLLAAICRLVDPLLLARTPKQWEAITAYRSLVHQREVAAQLGVTRQSVGDRLTAGHRRAVEEADAAIATFLSHIGKQRLPL
jgi:hypothetical protein